MNATGVVYLVGGGPGDPGLITLRGSALLRRADVVLHDRLIAPELLRSVRRDAQIISVGKAPGAHRVAQEHIHDLMIRYAREGKVVVRLKGGDPYVFGRGFEEFSACRAAGIPCVVVPGVSSALAAPLAAGIPVTSRLAVRSVAIVTGSFAQECRAPALDYAALSRMDTLIIMMGLAPLGDMTASLIQAGRDPQTPAACIENATTPRQRVVCGVLADVASRVRDAGLQGPVVTVIGSVAAQARRAEQVAHQVLAETVPCEDGSDVCDSRDDAPLAGCRIAITRPRTRNRSIVGVLQRAGAEVVVCPLLAIRYVTPTETHAEWVENAAHYDWVVFTSAHAVQGFVRCLYAAEKDVRSFSGVRVAAVGPVTTRALRRIGLRADLTPTSSGAEALVEALLSCPAHQAPHRVLFPRGNLALPTVVERLRSADVRVDDVVVYHTVPVDPPPAARTRLADGLDAVMFYSPSAVHRWRALRLECPGALVVCIGPTTAAAAREAGFKRVSRCPGSDTKHVLAHLVSVLQGG